MAELKGHNSLLSLLLAGSTLIVITVYFWFKKVFYRIYIDASKVEFHYLKSFKKGIDSYRTRYIRMELKKEARFRGTDVELIILTKEGKKIITLSNFYKGVRRSF